MNRELILMSKTSRALGLVEGVLVGLNNDISTFSTAQVQAALTKVVKLLEDAIKLKGQSEVDDGSTT